MLSEKTLGESNEGKERWECSRPTVANVGKDSNWSRPTVVNVGKDSNWSRPTAVNVGKDSNWSRTTVVMLVRTVIGADLLL